MIIIFNGSIQGNSLCIKSKSHTKVYNMEDVDFIECEECNV